MVKNSGGTGFVLLPYKFTLLSNLNGTGWNKNKVLLPYKFTLLSNAGSIKCGGDSVLLPYKFTLLSNTAFAGIAVYVFYYPINLHYSQTGQVIGACISGFTTL